METNRAAIANMRADMDVLFARIDALEKLHVFPHDDAPQEKVVNVNNFGTLVSEVGQIGTDLLFLENQNYIKLAREEGTWSIEVSYFAGASRFLARSEDSLVDLLRYVREIVERDQSRAKEK